MTRHPVAATIEDTLKQTGRSQSWLGAEVAREEARENPYTQPTVSDWLVRIEDQPPRRVFAIERALELPAGTLSRALGFLPVDAVPATTPEQALEADGSIPRAAKAVLLDVLAAARKRAR